MKKENQLKQLSYLIQEFYSDAEVYQIDYVEERIYFTKDDECNGEYDMQAIVDRDAEEVKFQVKQGEDWYNTDWVSFDNVNTVNQADIF